ncbi:MAG TPA: hypothetical protein VFT41_12855 [Gemmatimonadaceae bacterium]|nr:hypothetical protein [Gemmatimonadaceae bacterium]
MKTKASEFDQAFERGEDVSRYLDLSKARRPGLDQKKRITPEDRGAD